MTSVLCLKTVEWLGWDFSPAVQKAFFFLIRNTESGPRQTGPISTEFFLRRWLAFLGLWLYLELKHQFEWKRLLTACLSCDISLPSLARQLHENKHTIHLAVCLLPKPGWPHFLLLSLSLLLPHSPYLCLPSLFFFLFLPFSWSPPLRAKDPAFSHRVWCWRLSHCFLLQGNKAGGGGGRRQAWLPGCQLGVYVSVRKSRGDRSDDDRGTVYLLEWL